MIKQIKILSVDIGPYNTQTIITTPNKLQRSVYKYEYLKQIKEALLTKSGAFFIFESIIIREYVMPLSEK